LSIWAFQKKENQKKEIIKNQKEETVKNQKKETIKNQKKETLSFRFPASDHSAFRIVGNLNGLFVIVQ
jgi:hypothetical protein